MDPVALLPRRERSNTCQVNSGERETRERLILYLNVYLSIFSGDHQRRCISQSEGLSYLLFTVHLQAQQQPAAERERTCVDGIRYTYLSIVPTFSFIQSQHGHNSQIDDGAEQSTSSRVLFLSSSPLHKVYIQNCQWIKSYRFWGWL